MLPGYYEYFAHCPAEIRDDKTNALLHSIRDWAAIVGAIVGLTCSSTLLLGLMAG